MHGGDIYRNKIDLDFSVNVNPLGAPLPVLKAAKKSLKKIDQYPDIECEKLCCGIAKKFEVEKSSVVAGNGASELLPAIIRGNKIKKALLFSPCFLGYENALKSCEAEFCYFPRPDKSLEALKNELTRVHYDALFLTNPNNPDGYLFDFKTVSEIARLCLVEKTILIVDECFMELTGKSKTHSCVPLLKEFKNLIILRAFTKSFAIPGIRLGYCLCSNSDFAAKIKNQLSEWNVSLVAQEAGIASLSEDNYLKKSCDFILKERSWLEKELKALGFEVFPSSANFLLFFCDDEELKSRLIKKKILIRDCSDYCGLKKGFYRVAVKLHRENLRLLKELKALR